jgi:hypothetical protein
LILAGITINTLFGENGILTQTQNSKDSNRGGEIQEIIDLAISKNKIANYNGEDTVSKEEVIQSLYEEGKLTDDEVETLETSETIQIGSITVDFSELPKYVEKIYASDVSKNVTEYYGSVVENYNVKYDSSSTATNLWRIFYADSSNIYLIADDYMSYDYAPESGEYTIYKNGNYSLSFNNVFQNYDGSISINNSLASKWLSSYWKNYSKSTNSNIKAVAYLMDTNIWNEKFKINGYADYVIGGPTLEMYCASYKDTHSTSYLECEAESNSNGYKLKWKSSSSYQYKIEGAISKEDYNGIYIKKSTSKTAGMWIVGPAAYANCDFLAVFYNGNIDHDNYSCAWLGIRPVVCLSSSVHLEKQENGNYIVVTK